LGRAAIQRLRIRNLDSRKDALEHLKASGKYAYPNAKGKKTSHCTGLTDIPIGDCDWNKGVPLSVMGPTVEYLNRGGVTSGKAVAVILAAVSAAACLPSARGQLVWNPQVGDTAGGCPIVEVITSPSLVIGQQCSMANAMAGIDPSTPLAGADGLPTDPSTILTWRTTFRFFNRDHVVHNGTQQTFSPDGSTLFPVMWTNATGGSNQTTSIMGQEIAPLGSTKFVLSGLIPTTVASPFAVTSLALLCGDGGPCLVGETLVEQVDAAGNTKQAYTAADRATYSATPGNSFGAQMDVGCSGQSGQFLYCPKQDTTLIFLNPTNGIATVTVALWNGYNTVSDFATREATQVFATTTVVVQPSFGWFGWPFFMGFGAIDIGNFCANDAACESFISNPANAWKSGAPAGTSTLAVVTSDVPVIALAIRTINNPDGSNLQVGGYAFPLIPQQ